MKSTAARFFKFFFYINWKRLKDLVYYYTLLLLPLRGEGDVFLLHHVTRCLSTDGLAQCRFLSRAYQ